MRTRVRFPPPPPISIIKSDSYEVDFVLEEHWRNIDPQVVLVGDLPAERTLGRLMASTSAWSASFAYTSVLLLSRWPQSRWITVDVSRADRTLGSGEKPTKNDEPKTLPLPEELLDWIEEWVPKETRLRGEVLFTNPRTSGPWSEAALRRQWYRACDIVRVRISLYRGTKHSTATELRRQGVPLDVIQRLCGHRDKRSTEVYAKLADHALVEAIRRPRVRSAGRSPTRRT